jgi:hypothetical protein
MVDRIILMILIVEVFTHKCFDDNYHKIAYTSKHINIVEISFHDSGSHIARFDVMFFILLSSTVLRLLLHGGPMGRFRTSMN